jgi:hypothetical protein
LCFDIEVLELKCQELVALLNQNEQGCVTDNGVHRLRFKALEDELQRCNAKYKKLEGRLRSLVKTLQCRAHTHHAKITSC